MEVGRMNVSINLNVEFVFGHLLQDGRGDTKK
jgi:hypothetical protein